jgi:hypothetical protein
VLCVLFDGQFRYGFQDEFRAFVREAVENLRAAATPEVVQIVQIGPGDLVPGPRRRAFRIARLSRLPLVLVERLAAFLPWQG